MGTPPPAREPAVRDEVAALIARARKAQAAIDDYDQARVDELVTAAGWAIVEPSHNRALAERAVRDTGLGNVDDKIAKNRRKTIGLLRDLQGARSAGIIAEYPERGIIEIARPLGVVAAITPSTNPGATPANNILNALKGRNAIVLAPSPKGASTLALLIDFMHAELDRVGAPRDLVLALPSPVSREHTHELMRQADWVVATGSKNNVHAAYSSGTPALGVGVGNVAAIVDETADVAEAARRIAMSKTFDNATSCSSENSVIAVEAVATRLLDAFAEHGGVHLHPSEKRALEQAMFADGKLRPEIVAQSGGAIARRAGIDRARNARFLIVDEDGVGAAFPFSGEKLSPVLAFYRARDFDTAADRAHALLRFQGAGHSIGLHSVDAERATRLGLTLPVCRVIVNQVHCFATGGSFDNALPFSLSMGCGSWGGNSFSDNLNWRHFINVTRIVHPLAPERVREPTEDELFGAYRRRYGV
jgi:sulfoacetaldehyde dehydrogenase